MAQLEFTSYAKRLIQVENDFKQQLSILLQEYPLQDISFSTKKDSSTQSATTSSSGAEGKDDCQRDFESQRSSI